MFGVVIISREKVKQLLIVAVPDGAEQRGDGNFPFAIYLGGQNVTVAGLEFQPGTAGGYQFGRTEFTTRGDVFLDSEVDARRAQELAHHHPFRTAGDKGTLGCHQWYVSQENVLFFNLPGLFDQQLYPDINGYRES
ncbi:hypothetical protein ES703_57584 [subsurface metagenome]